jgi:hypothetical protein
MFGRAERGGVDMMRTSMRIVGILVLLLSFSQSYAQIYRERHTGIGIKGGLNVSDFYGSSVEQLAGAVGPSSNYIAGVFVSFPIKRRFTIQPEMNYSVKGAQRQGELIDSVNNVSYQGTLKTRISYLEIPVLFKVDLSTETRILPNLYAGPVVSFMQSAKVILKGDRQLEVAIDESVTEIDAGLVVGAGADFPFGTGYLTTEARLTLGLRTIDASAQSLSARNYVFSLMLGFRFPLIRTF